MIKPSNGRIVLYHRGERDRIPQHDPDQPLTAQVVHVWSDRAVSLVVWDSEGEHHFRREITLLQDQDQPPPNGHPWCEWMPYQKGQAAKAEQLEQKLSAQT